MKKIGAKQHARRIAQTFSFTSSIGASAGMVNTAAGPATKAAMEERREGRGLSRRREEYLSMGCPVKRITSTKDKDGINTYTVILHV